MNIAFHYHEPFIEADKGIQTTSPNGLFLDSIATHFDEIIVFAYSALDSELPKLNYTIISKTIRIVWLGKHSGLFSRFGRLPIVYKRVINELNSVEGLVMRAPTPLSILMPLLSRKTIVIPYLVGEYILEKQAVLPKYKAVLIEWFYRLINYSQNKVISGGRVLTNSAKLKDRYENVSKSIELVKSSTLKSQDFFRKPIEFKQPIKLVFTGRIEESKGIFEMLFALELLTKSGVKCEMHFAGFISNSIVDHIDKICKEKHLQECVFIHGLLVPGDTLNDLYRSCDIFVIASKSDFEGFPRVLWEAMANSLPIIAAPVSSIPYYLKHKSTAYFLDPSQLVSSIVEGVCFYINNTEKSSKIAKMAYNLAKDNTLETQGRRFYQAVNRVISHENNLPRK